eukprot:3800715-Prymnesium_polylepis.1
MCIRDREGTARCAAAVVVQAEEEQHAHREQREAHGETERRDHRAEKMPWVGCVTAEQEPPPQFTAAT